MAAVRGENEIRGRAEFEIVQYFRRGQRGGRRVDAEPQQLLPSGKVGFGGGEIPAVRRDVDIEEVVAVLAAVHLGPLPVGRREAHYHRQAVGAADAPQQARGAVEYQVTRARVAHEHAAPPRIDFDRVAVAPLVVGRGGEQRAGPRVPGERGDVVKGRAFQVGDLVERAG